MRAGIIAAGWGRRLGGGPKALTRVGDRTLIDLVIEGLVEAGADGITCIVNEQATSVCDHVRRGWPSLDVDWLVRTTATSMHSFLLVLERMHAAGEADCLMTTVDAVGRAGTTKRFVQAAAALRPALALGVTELIEDEKPLYAIPASPLPATARQVRGIRLQPDSVEERVRGIRLQPDSMEASGEAEPFPVARLSSEAGASPFVTAGFYWASPAILAEQDRALSAGFTALRQFLDLVVRAGHPCWAVPLPPVVDVDRPEDVVAAENLRRG